MPHWEDEGLILSIHKQGEQSAVVQCFTLHHGRHGGLVKGAFGKTHRGTFLPGNRLSLHWSARLPEHLGMWRAELLEPTAANIMSSGSRLSLLEEHCHLLRKTLPEHQPHPGLYHATSRWLAILSDLTLPETMVQVATLLWKACLLRELGFALDVSACAATGNTENLIYLSPKTGRAVSAEAGEPYRDKMLPLPAIFRAVLLADDQNESTETQRVDWPEEALTASRKSLDYFIRHWLLEHH